MAAPSRTRRLVTLVVLALLSLIGLACGGGPEPTTQPPGAPTVSPSLQLPRDLPVYQSARLMNALPTAQGGIAVTWEVDAPIDVVSRFYRRSLERPPWVIIEVIPSLTPQGSGIIISFQRQGDPSVRGVISTSLFPRQPPAVGYKTIISLTYRGASQATPEATP